MSLNPATNGYEHDGRTESADDLEAVRPVETRAGVDGQPVEGPSPRDPNGATVTDRAQRT